MLVRVLRHCRSLRRHIHSLPLPLPLALSLSLPLMLLRSSVAISLISQQVPLIHWCFITHITHYQPCRRLLAVPLLWLASVNVGLCSDRSSLIGRLDIVTVIPPTSITSSCYRILVTALLHSLWCNSGSVCWHLLPLIVTHSLAKPLALTLPLAHSVPLPSALLQRSTIRTSEAALYTHTTSLPWHNLLLCRAVVSRIYSTPTSTCTSSPDVETSLSLY